MGRSEVLHLGFSEVRRPHHKGPPTEGEGESKVGRRERGWRRLSTLEKAMALEEGNLGASGDGVHQVWVWFENSKSDFV